MRHPPEVSEYLGREREGLQGVEAMTASGPQRSIVRVAAKKQQRNHMFLQRHKAVHAC